MSLIPWNEPRNLPEFVPRPDLTHTCQAPEASAAARTISRHLGMRGAWFCQFKRDVEGRLTLLEVAPRIAGASGINRTELGVNLTERMLNEHLEGAGQDGRSNG